VQKLCDRVAIIKEGTIVKVEQIKTLLENSTKRFTLELCSTPDASLFEIQGVSDLSITPSSASFLFRGHINEITRLLASLDLSDLLVEEPDLEEIFMHYYQKDDEQ